MGIRLDQEKQKKLEPLRMKSCKTELEKLGFEVRVVSKTELQFEFMGSTIRFWPYSGWHSGKTILDGRGFNNLVYQLLRIAINEHILH